MNNKGFAITTLIYGLSIMGIMLMTILIGVMSTNRSNNKALSSEIDKELTRFSKTETNFAPEESGQEYVVRPDESGWYRIELWGASGGTTKNADGTYSVNGGAGAYTSGLIELEEDDMLYFYVGRSSANSGGSTDVRVINQQDKEGYDTRIMVAAGGGASPGSDGGTLKGYNASMKSHGGKLEINGSDAARTYNLQSGINNLVDYKSDYAIQNPYNAEPNPNPMNNGGSGYFSSTSSSVGGTSFIAGYAGAKSEGQNPGVVAPARVFNEETGTLEEINKLFYFVDGLMFAGVNYGDGSAKIEKVAAKDSPDKKLRRVNEKLNNVSSITDCVSSGEPVATRISAVANGEEKVTSFTTSGNCATATINGGTGINLDEIAVWHQVARDYVNHTIKVNGSVTLKGQSTVAGVTLSETETPVGYRISAYQPDFTSTIPNSGNYYIMPVLTENKVITAQADSDKGHNPVKLEEVNGYKRQMWAIRLITNKKVSPDYVATDPNTYEYSITEMARHRALNILLDENIEKNQIGASDQFNSKRRNEPQIWKVKPMGNGTYTISTVEEKKRKANDTGNIFAQFDLDKDKPNEVLIGINNNNTERFKLISVDYSSS